MPAGEVDARAGARVRFFLGKDELPFVVERSRTMDPEHRVQDLHLRAEHPLFHAMAHIVELGGVRLLRTRHAATSPAVFSVERDAARLLFHVGLRGGGTARAEGVPGVLSHQPSQGALVYVPSTRTTFAVERDECNEAFEVSFTIPALLEWARRYPELLEPIADRVERGDPFRLTRWTGFTTPALLATVDAMMNSRAHGPLREMYLEAKIVELLVQQLGPSTVPPPARAPDVDRMMEARDRLLAQLDDPPIIPELARSVGTNAFRLKRDFKAVFGQTVRAFVLSRRLDRARSLLIETRRSIKEIASAVGYSHVAHLSSAFKRRYGVSPSAVRKRPRGD